MTTFTTLLANKAVFITLIGIYSLLIGSLLNAIIYRLPIMLMRDWKTQCNEFLHDKVYQVPKEEAINLFFPRSFCSNCKSTIKAWQNIPVISYLLLRGKCHQCKTPIPIRYPLIECLTLFLSLAVGIKFGISLTTLFALLFTWYLVCMTFIDLDHQLLPDSLTLSLLWIGLLVNSFALFTPLSNAVFSAAAAYCSLWIFVKLFYLITGKEGMGNGDFKLFAAFGAWFGWQSLPFILIFSSLLGAIIGILFLKFSDKSKDTPIPFGPFLCGAAWLYMMWGEQIIQWYLGFYR